MPTKAELEAEIEKLKADLAKNRAPGTQHDATPEPDVSATQDDTEITDQDDASRQITDLMKEFEAAAENHPGLALFGVFFAGILVGRFVGR